jgi:3-hydroxyacyl-[acyl-carrier-protein] dehydratase
MPAKNDVIFKISKLEHHDGVISAALDINKDCTVFKGHFPGQPVVPGACMLQLVKDVLEAALGTALRLKKAEHLKFISMIDPTITQKVLLDFSCKFVEEASLNVTAKLIAGEVVCFKFQGIFLSA